MRRATVPGLIQLLRQVLVPFLRGSLPMHLPVGACGIAFLGPTSEPLPTYLRARQRAYDWLQRIQ